MDQIFQTLITWQFVLFCLTISAVLFIIRVIFEYILKNSTISQKITGLWKELILPIMPLFVGCLGSLIFKTFPYPNGLATVGGRFMFGLVAGLLSGLIYRIIKSMLLSKINLNITDPEETSTVTTTVTTEKSSAKPTPDNSGK